MLELYVHVPHDIHGLASWWVEKSASLASFNRFLTVETMSQLTDLTLHILSFLLYFGWRVKAHTSIDSYSASKAYFKEQSKDFGQWWHRYHVGRAIFSMDWLWLPGKPAHPHFTYILAKITLHLDPQTMKDKLVIETSEEVIPMPIHWKMEVDGKPWHTYRISHIDLVKAKCREIHIKINVFVVAFGIKECHASDILDEMKNHNLGIATPIVGICFGLGGHAQKNLIQASKHRKTEGTLAISQLKASSSLSKRVLQLAFIIKQNLQIKS